ncbi:MAG: hypothetical protein J5I93_17735, partial [Pirellulaceae bacterium]|nr:hypothetical protein [Pirellulaceae bacterium]
MPHGADPQTVVRCPLCQEEFELALVLDALPPSLIVVSAPARTADASLGSQRPAFLSAASVAVADEAGADAEDEFRLAADEDASPRPFQLAAGTAGTATVKAGQRAPGRAKKQKNPLVEVAKIVAGGVVGLSIGYVLVWWIPLLMGRTPRDPVQGVAPMVGRYVPWIVPAQLRGASSSPESDSDGGGFDATAA